MRQPRNLPDAGLIQAFRCGVSSQGYRCGLLSGHEGNHDMSAAQRLGIQFNGCCDEPEEPAQSDLTFRLKLSTELGKRDQRIAELERQVEEQRQTLNRVLTRFTVEGRPIPMEGITT